MMKLMLHLLFSDLCAWMGTDVHVSVMDWSYRSVCGGEEAESRDSLCTWRGRYAASCAADPEASQNDLSVGNRKERAKGGFSSDCCTCSDSEEDTDMSSLQPECLSDCVWSLAPRRETDFNWERYKNRDTMLCTCSKYKTIRTSWVYLSLVK